MGVDIGHRLWSATPALSWHALRWPKELDAKLLHAWLQALGGNKASRGVRFVIVAEAGSIQHFIALPCRHEHSLIASLASFLPSVEVSPCEPVNLSATMASKLRMTTKQRVLEAGQPEVVSHAILSSMQALHGTEGIVYQWLLGRRKSPDAVSTTVTAFHSGTFAGATLEAMAGRTPAKLDTVARTSMRNKRGAASWDAALLIGVTANTKRRREQLLGQIAGAAKSAEAPGVRLGTQPIPARRLLSSYTPFFWPLNINVDELAGLLAWPLGNRPVNGLARAMYRRQPLPAKSPRYGLSLADSAFNDGKALVLPLKDRMTHMQILGPTNAGKSTLMLDCMVQDATSGYGFAFIDFKGDLVRDFLARVPKERIPDVVVIDLSDTSCPVGINPLARVGRNASMRADDILAIFNKLYGSYIGPRSQDLLHTGLLTLMRVPGMSLCALPSLYTNAEFRAQMLGKVSDPLLRDAWTAFNSMSANERNGVISPLMNKLRPFLLRPNIRLSIGQGSPKFDVAEVFTKRKILLVNLAKGTSGSEAARLFGSFVISQIMQEIRRRSALKPEQRRPAFLYIDEVQEYWRSNDDFNEALEQFRSNNVGLVFAHQYLGQLSKEKRDGLTNARNRVVFQTGHDDAVTMAKGSEVLTPEDFENLPRFHVYAQLSIEGHVTPWVSGITRPPADPSTNPADIIAASRQRYGIPAQEVEQEMYNLLSQPKGNNTLVNTTDPAAIGRKKLTLSEIVENQFSYRDIIGRMS